MLVRLKAAKEAAVGETQSLHFTLNLIHLYHVVSNITAITDLFIMDLLVDFCSNSPQKAKACVELSRHPHSDLARLSRL